jgi:uncharacterized short protein YbdD (DUF466 family)
MSGEVLRRGWRAVSWYVRDVVGENDYDKYVEHLLRRHPGQPAPSRRDFERAKTDRMEANPKARCC